MQFGGQGKPPLGVLYDADFGNTIDVPLALALLYGLQVKNESRVVAVTTSRPSVNSAAFADVLVRFYTGEPGGFAVAQSIGMPTGTAPEDTPMLADVLAKPYSRGIKKLNDTADPVAVLRNALSAQFDGNGTVVMAGPPTNLVRLLDLPGAKELIARKARLLCVADAWVGPGTKKLLAEWPTGIVAVPKEVGEALLMPASAIEKELAWAPAHPIVDAWKAVGAKDAPSGAMAAALSSVRTEGLFKLSDPGTLREDGSFAPSSGGKHRVLGVDPATKDKVMQAYLELASTKQVPRRGRRGG
jgi:hypothetical protein